jgi:hypothetical protein
MIAKYKHSRLCLLLWTLLVFFIGHGNAALQSPRVAVIVQTQAAAELDNDAACTSRPLPKQTTQIMNGSM